MGKQCEIVQDLLPLYVDEACSETSMGMVREHIEGCPECRAIYQKMRTHTSEDILKEEKESVIIRHEKKERQNFVKCLLAAIAFLYIPVILILPLIVKTESGFIATNYAFDLTVLVLFTAPCYLAAIELGLALCRLIEKHKSSVGEIILHAIGAVSALAIIVILILTYDMFPDQLLAFIGLSGILIVKWIVTAIVFKKKVNLGVILRQKTFWICCGCLLLTIALAIGIAAVSFGSPRQETLEHAVAVGVRETGSDYDGVYITIGGDEQHSWDVLGQKPTFVVKWVNDTDHEVRYDLNCKIYKSIDDTWVLCADEEIDYPDEEYVILPNSSVSDVYSAAGYEIDGDGLYKFVTVVDGHEVWFTFRVTTAALAE